jgi:type II secretory pathway pseudopilin PulG
MQKISKNPVNNSVCETVDLEEILNQLMATPTHTGSVGSFLAASLCKVQNDSYVDFAVCKSRRLNDTNESQFKISGKKAAFTLAETLIAIGIIGVVSALTIPTLMHKYKLHVIEKNLQKSYAEISNMLRQSEAENGSFEGWDFTLSYSDFMNTYILPYFQVSSCTGRTKGNYCFDKNLGLWKYGANEAVAVDESRARTYYSKDGRFFVIWPLAEQYGVYAIRFIVDVNGSTGNSIMGQDVFGFVRTTHVRSQQYLEVARGGNGPSSVLTDTTLYAYCAANNQPDNMAYCGEIIRRNGWKFPKDYPLKF